MTTDDETKNTKIQSLELGLEEQRRDYEVLSSLYGDAKTKNITFLAAALALLAYLYGVAPENATMVQRLFIPDETYGLIIYFLALFVFLMGIIMLLFALKPQRWLTAYDNNQEDCISDDYERYLLYMKKQYLRASSVNGQSFSNKRKLLDMSFIPLLSGGILLLLLKTFGG